MKTTISEAISKPKLWVVDLSVGSALRFPDKSVVLHIHPSFYLHLENEGRAIAMYRTGDQFMFNLGTLLPEGTKITFEL